LDIQAILSEFNQVHITIHKEEVVMFNVEPVVDVLHQIKEAGIDANGRLVLSFDGYDDDARELAEIPEVRDFMLFLDKCFPYWFFFLNRNISSQIIFITNCLVKIEIIHSSVDLKERFFEFDKNDFSNFIDIHFHFLNELTNQLRLPEEENEKISNEITSIYKQRITDRFT